MAVPTIATLLLLLVEGATSFVILLNDGFGGTAQAAFALGSTDGSRPPSHLWYDPDLGWTSLAGSAWPDFYGPGKDVRIDAAGFRCTTSDCAAPAPDETVVVCAGDSFTFGSGVGDEEAWCSLIGVEVPGVHTLNIGEPGYGVGQAYLRYLRDLEDVDHDVVIFAVIGADFRRMASDRFQGVPKPVLRLGQDGLRVNNVPVPLEADLSLRLDLIRAAVAELRLVTFFRRLTPDRQAPTAFESVRGVSAHVFQRLDELTRARGARLVLVYLPILEEYVEPIDVRRAHVRTVADSLAIVYVDLVDALKELEADQVDRLFLSGSDTEHPEAPGHYSAEGNAWVAGELRGRLQEWLPDEAPGRAP